MATFSPAADAKCRAWPALPAFLAALAVSASAQATPMLSSAGTLPVSGWANVSGTFAVDTSGPAIAGMGQSTSYSTATSAYALTGSSVSFGAAAGGVLPATMRIDASIAGNGTASGNLLGGSFSLLAGATGVPAFGIAAGDTLMLGQVIDSAALQGNYDTEFLIRLTYTNPLLPGFGEYLTYFNPDSNSWGNDLLGGGGYQPWAREVSRVGGFTFWDLMPTHRLPEPGSLALLALGGGLLVAFTRRRSAADSAMPAAA